MAKEIIYLTDLMPHTRDFRQTTSFEKARKKGRIYSPLPADYTKNVDKEAHTMKFSITLPKDLQERIKRGEVEIRLPAGGLPLYLSPDMIKTAIALQKQAHREDVHDKWGKKTWQDGKSGV